MGSMPSSTISKCSFLDFMRALFVCPFGWVVFSGYYMAIKNGKGGIVRAKGSRATQALISHFALRESNGVSPSSIIVDDSNIVLHQLTIENMLSYSWLAGQRWPSACLHTGFSRYCPLSFRFMTTVVQFGNTLPSGPPRLYFSKAALIHKNCLGSRPSSPEPFCSKKWCLFPTEKDKYGRQAGPVSSIPPRDSKAGLVLHKASCFFWIALKGFTTKECGFAKVAKRFFILNYSMCNVAMCVCISRCQPTATDA